MLSQTSSDQPMCDDTRTQYVNHISISISAVKWLIVINRIQNKSFGLHIKCVCTVYIYYEYINTHTSMYIFQKNVLRLYIKYIYMLYKLYNYINVNIFKIYAVCVRIYLHNK